MGIKNRKWFDDQLDNFSSEIMEIRNDNVSPQEYKNILRELKSLVSEYVDYLCRIPAEEYGKEFDNPAMIKPECFYGQWDSENKRMRFPVVESHHIELMQMCKYAVNSFDSEKQSFSKYIYSSTIKQLSREYTSKKNGISTDCLKTGQANGNERIFNDIIDFAEDRGLSLTSIETQKKLQRQFGLSDQDWKDLQLYLASGRNIVSSIYLSNEDGTEINLTDVMPDTSYLDPEQNILKKEKLEYNWNLIAAQKKEYSEFEKAVLTHHILYESDFDTDVIETLKNSKIVSLNEFEKCFNVEITINEHGEKIPHERTQEEVCKDYDYSKSYYNKIIERISDKDEKVKQILFKKK